jgi:hypothetical protein
MTLHPALPDTAGDRLLQIVIRPKVKALLR